jgi:hypothetical protein
MPRYLVLSIVLRIVGILLILPSLAPRKMSELVPAMIDPQVSWTVFAVGAVVFMAGALVSFIGKNKERDKGD